jgi:hypothetical protein
MYSWCVSRIIIDYYYMDNYFTGEYYADCFIMTDILDQLDFYSGTESKPLQVNKRKGSGRMLYGYTWKGFLKWDGEEKVCRTESPYKGLYNTKIKDQHPELEDIFKEFAQLYFPNHIWDSVQITRDFLIKRHRDKQNIGTSIICGFGDFKKGYLVIEKDRDLLNKGEIWCPRAVDIKAYPFEFNGYEYYHYNTNWIGTRFVLVFFRGHKNLELR